VDQKLIDHYGIEISKWTRARRKRSGTASVQYLRFRRFFVLLATHGKHRFFTDEAPNILDFPTDGGRRVKGLSGSLVLGG
jgi:hypothetical protein